MDKTILITGASKGIGLTIAKLFADKGWNVVATMRNTENASVFADYKNVFVTALDITKPETIEQSISKAIVHFGKIDVLVNNAAYGLFGLFEAAKPEEIEKQFQSNVFGTMNVTRAILPHFRKNKQGTIINISSGAGRVGFPMISLYTASKFAIEGFAESLYFELLTQNIKIKLVEPGGVDTGFHQTAAERFAFDEKLTDYNEFTEKFTKKFEQMHDGMATPQQVADVVYEAATDGKNDLRYIIGNDIKDWVKARTTLTEAGYISYMKEMYGI